MKQVVGSSNDASVIKHLNQNFDRALHAFQVSMLDRLMDSLLTITLQTETVLDIANRLETQGP